MVIASHFYDPDTGEKISAIAEYDLDTDTFTFATGQMMGKINGLSDADTALLFAAHEAMHAVQVEKGDPPIPTRENKNYDNDRHENEAWLTAAKVLKDKYPEASGEIRAGNIKVNL